MSFGNLGFMEILILLVLVLLLFGAKRLPEIGASMGKGIREFKKSITDVDQSLNAPSRPAADRLATGDTIPQQPVTEEERPEPRRLLG